MIRTETQARITRVQVPLTETPFHEWIFSDGTVWCQFFRVGTGYLLRFPGLADFTVAADGMEILTFPHPDVSAQTIDHLYFNQVVPLALSRQFKLVLHASAVEIKEVAVAFLGDSGRGKSTLAASFSTSGHRFLTDDGLQLENVAGSFLITPSHPSIRLWEDSREVLIPQTSKVAPPLDYTPKARLLADNEIAYCDVKRPLCCIYFLGEGDTDTVSIQALSGRDAMLGLIKNCFLLDIEERAMLTHHFSVLSDLARLPLFYQLDYPREYELLPQVRAAVTAHVDKLCLQMPTFPLG